MAGEFMIVIMMFIAIVVIALTLAPRKKELTAAERISYESERGRLLAQQEMGRSRRW